MMEQATEGEPWKKYERGPQIGEGAYGKVFLLTLGDKKYALKTISKKFFMRDPRLLKYFQSEKELMASTKSPYIVQLIDSWVTKDAYQLLLEYCPFGTIDKYIEADFEAYPIDKIPSFFAQLLLAMFALHRNNIIHRDLKLDNILIGDGGILKLTDFGIAKKVVGNALSMLGTPGAKAPEVYFGEPYSTKADIWSLGIILYQLYHKMKKPFDTLVGSEKVFYYESIKKRVICGQIPSSARDLIRKMLVVNQEERINWLGIHQHPFVKQILSNIGQDELSEDIFQRLFDAKIFYQINEKNLQRMSEIQRKIQFLYRQVYRPWIAGITARKSFDMIVLQFLLTLRILQMYIEAKKIRNESKDMRQTIFTQLEYLQLKSSHQDLYFQLNVIMMKNRKGNLKDSEEMFSELYFKKIAFNNIEAIEKSISGGEQIWKNLFTYIQRNI